MSGRTTALKRAKQMRVVMLDYGVPEVAVGGLLPGRPGPADPWNGLNPVSVFSHHIVSRPTPENPVPGLRLVREGTGALPGPLCNGTAGVDLVYRIITLGWANHPGFGGPYTFRGPLGSFTVPRDNARPYAWGTEYEGGLSEEVWDRTYTNKRTGKSMTFREFMGRCNAALTEAIWLPGINSHGEYDDITPGMDLSGYHGEHKTWAPTRKIDRLGYTTESGRAEIRRFNQKEEDDMEYKDWSRESREMLADDIADRLFRKERVNVVTDKGRAEVSVKNAITRAGSTPTVVRNNTDEIIQAIEGASEDQPGEA